MKPKSTVAQLLQQRRKAYQKGGAFSWKPGTNTTGLSSAANLAGSLVGMADPGDQYGVQSDEGATASGALQGASAGMALGPVGAIGGALIGGISSYFGNETARKHALEAKQRKQNLDQAKAMQESQAILAQYDNMGTGIKSLKNGGVTWSWPGGYSIEPFKVNLNKHSFSEDPALKFQEGGEIPAGNGKLKPIGESESYEVEGHNPEATDDVILGNAAVDHDEVVKPSKEGLRIFSDTLKPPGSKVPFSKIAKQLEKQKTKDEKRFPEQNKKIEEKLEHLFQVQQAMNGDSDGETEEEAMVPEGEEKGEGFTENDGSMFATGGRLYPIEVGEHKMSGISFQPHGKYAKTYHDITPAAFGAYRPIGFGSEVMAGSLNRVSAESIYRRNAPHIIKGRYKAGGNLMMNFKRPTYETAAEGLFEQPPGYHHELQTEPGHGPGAATFKEGGIYIKPSKRGSFTAWAKKHHMGVQEAASHVMAHKGSYSSAIVKKANFAKNASKWHHELGGMVPLSQVTFPAQSDAGMEDDQDREHFKSGGIHIKPENKGKFTATKKATGKTTEELTHSKNPLTRKRAIFAQNAKKWHHHQAGGVVDPSQLEYKPWGDVYNQTDLDAARKANLLKGEGTGTELPPAMMKLFGNMDKRPVKGYSYIDLPLEGVDKLPGNLREQASTEDPFPEYPGRRVTGLYYDKAAETPEVAATPVQKPIAYIQPKTGNLKPVKHTPQGFDYSSNKPAKGSITRRGLQKGGWLGNPNWSDVVTSGATLAPVFANMQAARNLPQVPDVYLNKPVNLRRNSYADQLNMLSQGLRTASLASRQNSVNPNAQQAGIGNAQAQYLNATNQMFGDINRSNNDIQRQEAMINAQIAGANNQLLGQRSQAETARQANQLYLQSHNRADLSNKLLGMTQQENMKALDKQRYQMFLAWLNKQGAGLGDRAPFLNMIAPQQNVDQEHKRMGGIVKPTRRLMRKAC